ncbi:MAG: tetratricopeptide repeat protein [Bryobacterales bacterium]|nr:tetratricopeptide repeat protein [Bryobacterales bacterium]
MLSAVLILVCALLQSADPSAEGLKALDAKDYETAARSFALAVEADPKDFAAHFHLALANSLLGKTAEAIAGYKTVLALKPGLYEAELNLGRLLLDRKQPGEAIPLLSAAAAGKPLEFRPNFYLAEALLAAGDLPKAEEHYLICAGAEPGSAAVQAGLARARARQGRLEDAEVAFRKAAALDGVYKEAILELAALYEDKGDLDKAIEIYAEFPEHAAAAEHRAILLIRTGKPAEAAPLLERLLAGEPGNAALRLTYGRVLRDLKKYPAAAAEFVKAVQAKPDFVEAWGELAAVFILLEDHPDALAALDRLKALGAEQPGHLYLRAIMLDKAKQPKLALESYERFLAASQGKSPEEEFQARQRARILKKELERR